MGHKRHRQSFDSLRLVRDSRRTTSSPCPVTPALSLRERENGWPLSVDSLLQGDGDAGVGNAVSEIDGAIDRIDNPTELRFGVANRALFTKNGH